MRREPYTRPVTANDDEALTASFEATVHKQGPNAYVDVPASVTHAFSAYGLEVGVWLRRRVEHPLFHGTETIAPDVHWHVARITEPEQIDALASLLCEAYAVGAQESG